MQKESPKSGDTIAVIKTNKGEMRAKLFPDLISEGVTNFVKLAEAGSYENVPFHRVIKDFMIQGGDFTRKDGTGGHSYKGEGTTIGDEYHTDLKHVRGALSFAKTSMPNSIGSQFFIVHPEKGSHFLDHPEGGSSSEGYTVFGQLFEGFDTLDSIAAEPTNSSDVPNEEVIIESVSIETFE